MSHSAQVLDALEEHLEAFAAQLGRQIEVSSENQSRVGCIRTQHLSGQLDAVDAISRYLSNTQRHIERFEEAWANVGADEAPY
jgi:hypothetical protein